MTLPACIASMLPLHAVPPLLHSVLSRQGNIVRDEHGGCRSNLKDLRLVCKYFNEIVSTAAKGYCLQLSDHPSTLSNIEQHWRVADMLRYAKLDRLRVLIIVGPGEKTTTAIISTDEPDCVQHSYIAGQPRF